MTADLMPAAFLGRGDPRNALSDRAPHPRLAGVRRIPAAAPGGRGRLRPLVRGMDSGHGHGATAHDPRLLGFPQALYDVEYPAPGSPEVAAEVVGAIAPRWVGLDRDGWGLDHGTW